MMGLIHYVISPSGFIAICILFGILTYFHRRTRWLSHISIITGIFVYLILSTGPVSYLLMKPLEFKYPAYEADTQHSGVPYIVVMAGFALDESYYPVSSKVNSSSLFRLVEANRLWRLASDRRIIITGKEDVPRIMRAVIEEMGIPKDRIIVETKSMNTYASAKNVSALIGDRPFLLVTSAGHMPRTMAAFQKLNLSPIPAPTDFQVGQNPFKANMFPTVQHLNYSEIAIHEFIGILWYRIRGHI